MRKSDTTPAEQWAEKRRVEREEARQRHENTLYEAFTKGYEIGWHDRNVHRVNDDNDMRDDFDAFLDTLN